MSEMQLNFFHLFWQLMACDWYYSQPMLPWRCAHWPLYTTHPELLCKLGVLHHDNTMAGWVWSRRADHVQLHARVHKCGCTTSSTPMLPSLQGNNLSNLSHVKWHSSGYNGAHVKLRNVKCWARGWEILVLVTDYQSFLFDQHTLPSHELWYPSTQASCFHLLSRW